MFKFYNISPLFIDFALEDVIFCNYKNQIKKTRNQRNILFFGQKSSSYNIVLIALTKIWENGFVSHDS